MAEHDEITRPLIDALNKTGGMALRMNSGKVRVKNGFLQLQAKGTADILFFPRGYILVPDLTFESATPVWIETKAVKKDHHKEQQENQAAFRAEVEALGHRWISVRSVKEALELLFDGKEA